jgi:hypothetical protein
MRRERPGRRKLKLEKQTLRKLSGISLEKLAHVPGGTSSGTAFCNATEECGTLGSLGGTQDCYR